MCGFAGFIDLKRRLAPETRARICRAMAEAIRHRGPDDEGTWSDDDTGLILAFRRLAIIDTSAAGHQPMVSASGRSVIVFNGEIYNARALAKDLALSGHRFRGQSDTEVLLEAFERWGIEATLPRLVGMFAIAWYERANRRVVLIRDRLGKKPLYFGTQGGTLFFGSQPKSFFAHPDWQPEIDRNALALFMHYGYVPAPHSIYCALSSLRPGECVTLINGKLAERRLYWDIRQIAAAGQVKPLALTDEEAKTELAACIEAAVTDRLASDVPLGAFLSGGIDSSTIAAFMQRARRTPIKTFSIGFEESAYDEGPFAAAVARHLGTEHHALVVRPADALAAIPRIADYYDEPFADSSQIATILLSRLTREFVTVALSGDGGDELFAGYTRYGLADDLLGKINHIPRALRSSVSTLLERTPAAVWQRLESLVPTRYGRSPLSGRIKKLSGLLSSGAEERLYQGLVGQWPEPERLVLGATPSEDAIWQGALAKELPERTRRFQLIDTLTYLPDDILVKVDRASMAVALEARVPLLDHRLVEFVWRLPTNMLVRGGESKWLLRQVLYDHVPRALVDRPKMGFGVPIDRWLRGPLREWAEDLLDESRLRSTGLLNPTPIRAAWAEHLAGTADWSYRLWCVLMFEAWRRRWMA